MNGTDLLTHLQAFVRTRLARALCKRYGTEAVDSLGYLWLHLHSKCAHLIVQNPQSWVKRNAAGHLKNYLNRECQQLGWADEDHRPEVGRSLRIW